MRIVGGTLGGRRIKAPAGPHTRPTAERVREALFSILGPPLPGTRVLDLFAGAGSLGLEALSRGAADAIFVDSSRLAVRTLRDNIDALALGERAEVVADDVASALVRLAKAAQEFRLVFIDPPYQSELAAQALAAIGATELLSADGIVIVEHDRRNQPGPSHGSLVRTDTRRYGDTEISFYQRKQP